MKKLFWVLPLMTFTVAAQAHTGHAHMSLMDGLVHPFGFDHLLAMVVVGLWSVRALQGKIQWFGPLAFVTSLVLGALFAHVSAIEWAFAEYLIAGSVVALASLMLLPNVSKVAGFALVVSAGLVHGWAHGAEAATGGVFTLYVAGFVLTTALLHGLGMLLGRGLLNIRAVWSWRTLGALMAGYGVYALSMLG